jgi:hypothetical protein
VALKSALEDFEGTTLATVSGLLGRLHYLAGLHDGHGKYSHWGMSRVHGEEAARRAIRTSHAFVLAQVLRTPLSVLDEDLQRSASGGKITAHEFLESLKKLAPQALPSPQHTKMGGAADREPDRSLAASEKHFMAVLHALSALLANRATAIHPDASPPLPPAQ